MRAIETLGTTLGTKIDTLGTKIDAMGSELSTKMDAMITSMSGASYAGGTASVLSQLPFASQKSTLWVSAGSTGTAGPGYSMPRGPPSPVTVLGPGGRHRTWREALKKGPPAPCALAGSQ